MQGGSVVIIGAGPAGLTAGYLLSKQGVPVTVLESDPVYVGGIARTVRYKGYRFDIGGHRFFSKVPLINELWEEMLGEDFLVRPRLSRIGRALVIGASAMRGAELTNLQSPTNFHCSR